MEFRRHSLMLLCSSVPNAQAFYQRHLALETAADLGWFVGLRRPGLEVGDFELCLCEAEHPTLPATLRRPTDGLVLGFEVDDARDVREQFGNAGVEILIDLVDEPWGQRHFHAAAPDGVSLDIFQSIEPDAAWMKQNGLA